MSRVVCLFWSVRKSAGTRFGPEWFVPVKRKRSERADFKLQLGFQPVIQPKVINTKRQHKFVSTASQM